MTDKIRLEIRSLGVGRTKAILDAELALLREQVRVLAEQEQEQTAVIKCIVDHHQDTNSGCPEGSTLKCDYDCHSCWVAWAKNHLNAEAKRRIAERKKGGEG